MTTNAKLNKPTKVRRERSQCRHLPESQCIWAAATVILCILTAPAVFGQSGVPASPSNQAARVPLPHLYWHFLTHQNQLDKTAAAREQEGKDGIWLRNYYQQKLGFTDEEFAKVRTAAVQLESDLDKIDNQVQKLEQDERSHHPRVQTSPHNLPPVPPQLVKLRAQREQLIQSAMESLRTALGEEQAAKLDEFLQTEFVPRVTVQPTASPRPHAPSAGTVPPSPSKVHP